jgi:hypothetical protein
MVAPHRRSVDLTAIILSVVLSTTPCLGTTVVVFLKNGEIWIAADSMETETTTEAHAHSYICKIQDAGTFYFAIAGPYTRSNDGFSVKDIVRKVKPSGTLHDVAAAFIGAIDAPVKREMRHLIKRQPATFAKFMRRWQGHIVQVVFARIEGGHARSARVDISIRVVKEKIEVTATPTYSLDDRGSTAIGSSDQALMLVRGSSPQAQTDPAALLRSAVGIEAKLHPETVGGRLSILRLTSQGARWVEGGECN